MHLSFFSLSEVEFKKFVDFLKSPFFNSNKIVIDLANLLYSTGYDEFSKPGGKSLLKKKLNTSRDLPDTTFRRYFSTLNSLYEKFLSISTFLLDESTQKINLNQSLLKRGEFDLVEKVSRKNITHLEEQFLKDDQVYLNTAWFYDDIYNAGNESDNKKSNELLKKKSDNLDLFYFFSKLHTYSAQTINKENFKFEEEEEDKMIPHILEYFNSNLDIIKKSHPNLYIVYLQLMFYKSNYDKKYTGLYEEYLKDIWVKLDKERQFLYSIYLGSMFQKLKELNDKTAWEKSFYNHKVLIDSENITVDNYLMPSLFLNIVFEALYLRKFNWLRKFLDKNTGLLRKEDRNNYSNLAYARLCLYEAKYDEAIKHLESVKTDNPVMFFNVKIVMCFIYLEKNDALLLDTLKDSLRNYKKRNKSAADPISKNISIFLTLMNRLQSGERNEFELQKLLKDILDNSKYVPAKNLFIDRINATLENLR